MVSFLENDVMFDSFTFSAPGDAAESFRLIMRQGGLRNMTPCVTNAKI